MGVGADFGTSAGGGAGCDGSDGWSLPRICSTFLFGSVVFMQKFKFDEFCWSYFGRALICFASASPKMLEWPPPGGFNTRLELFAPGRPTLNSVDVMMFLKKALQQKNTKKIHNN